jgi:flagellin-like protein
MLFEQVGCGAGSSAVDDARSGGRGQSEVIGTILTVAIVVILGAVVGQYVFGLDIIQAGEQNVGPQISFDTTIESNGDLVIRHESGNGAETSELSIVGSESDVLRDSSALKSALDEEWTSSEAITLTESELTDGETVRIIWESSTTGDSTVILKYEYTP